ncbi:hypothetical protein D9M68_737940 [compost metagenome]
MRLPVRVPVLSLHSTVVAPSVSIALMRRVSTPSVDRRRAPSAGNTVITTGYSSGSIAMASAMPASNACSQSPRTKPCTNTSARLSASASSARLRTSCAVCFCRGERSFSSVPSAVPMRPISLRAPVAITRASA